MDLRGRFSDNPFFVLAVPIEASRQEVERAGQKLLAELAVGRESAKTYRTPLGPATRTEGGVRSALAELRDPERRLEHEAWASAPLSEPPATGMSSVSWTDVLILVGCSGGKG
jgi:hypothetical protein